MTQITKTLSIAGIIALVTAPAMADIASTAYVQNIVNNMIPTSGTVGHVLKKTTSGVEWAAAPTPTLETTTGQSTTATMTQKAITDALNSKLSNNAAANSTSVAIGAGAIAATPGDSCIAIGEDASATGERSIAIGYNAQTDDDNVIQLGDNSEGFELRVGYTTLFAYDEYEGGGIPSRLLPNGDLRVQKDPMVGDVGVFVELPVLDLMGEVEGTEDYTLLTDSGVVPYERFAPEIPNTCKAANNQTCALVIKWNSAQNKFTQSWEVVKVSE